VLAYGNLRRQQLMTHYISTDGPRVISTALAAQIEALAESLLGKPTQRLGNELRYRRKGSLSVAVRGDKRGSFYDHERGEGGDALELVRQVNGGTVSDAMRWARDWLGVDPCTRPAAAPTTQDAREVSTQDEAGRIERALAIWGETVPLFGTAAEEYLRGRRIAPSEIVTDLRFHPNCPAGPGKRSPAMVALLRDVITNEPCGIHRTILRPDGSNRDEAGNKLPKMMLGRAKGAVIKLCDDAEITLGLGLAEGIENALTLAAYGWWQVWAASDKDHVATFPVLAGIEALTIFADNKKSDDLDAARKCAIRWQEAGRSVEIHSPPAGADWNDIVQRVAA
jgi:putative DNA primase/helicase